MNVEAMHVLFRLERRLFALPADAVEEMLELPPVTRVPLSPPACRGVMNLRGRVIAVADLRVLLGLPTRQAELSAINMPQRRQDHLNWVNELEASVREDREFKLTTDPHGCAFGKWYDRFRTDDPWLKAVLAEFDEPHKALHATAVTVTAYMQQHRQAEAAALVTHLRETTLATLGGLFDKAIDALEQAMRETAIVVRHGAEQVAFTVDQMVGAEALSELGDIEAERDTWGEHTQALLASILQRPSTEELVFELDATEDSRLFAWVSQA